MTKAKNTNKTNVFQGLKLLRLLKGLSVFSLIASSVTPLASNGLEAAEAPVKVYILAGQSNMVGIGQVSGSSSRWGDEFMDPVVSVYEGEYDPSKDYDALTPIKTVELESFGGVSPQALPGGGTQVVRGELQVKETGIYEFSPGHGQSRDAIMYVDGREVFQRMPGELTKQKSIKLDAGKKVPFKVVFVTEHASGLGWFGRVDFPGTLKTLVNVEGKFPYLIDEEGRFAPRDDVWYRGVVTATANQWLNVGCGANSASIGPELGFGHKVGNFHDEPVLLLKASQGNRSLGWDFLPPGSERFEHTEPDGTTYIYAGYKDTSLRWEKGTEPGEGGSWYGGTQYDECFDAAKEVLANFDKNFPHWKGRGYEIVGFGWWQGHKDGGEGAEGQAGAHALHYEKNLVQLIHVLREEFEAPKAPFVVATVGFNGGEGWQPGSSAQTIWEAQIAVSDPQEHPEFADNVASVDTRPFYRPPEESPRNQSFHYHGNAETYMLVGEAMGKAMLELKTKGSQ